MYSLRTICCCCEALHLSQSPQFFYLSIQYKQNKLLKLGRTNYSSRGRGHLESHDPGLGPSCRAGFIGCFLTPPARVSCGHTAGGRRLTRGTKSYIHKNTSIPPLQSLAVPLHTVQKTKQLRYHCISCRVPTPASQDTGHSRPLCAHQVLRHMQQFLPCRVGSTLPAGPTHRYSSHSAAFWR